VKYAGSINNYAVYVRGSECVYVNMSTFDVTDPQPLTASALDVATLTAAADGQDNADLRNAARQAFLSVEMLASGSEMVAVPQPVKTAANRALRWAKVYGVDVADADLQTASLLANSDEISLQKLRHVARFFPRRESTFSTNEGWTKSQAGFPSESRITWDLWGGDASRQWSTATVATFDIAALTASAYSPDEFLEVRDPVPNEFDPDKPHQFFPTVQLPFTCTYCLKADVDEVHSEGAINYGQVELSPDDTHMFSESLDDTNVCEICDKEEGSYLHQNAIIAQYRIYPEYYAVHHEAYQPPVDPSQKGLTADGYLDAVMNRFHLATPSLEETLAVAAINAYIEDADYFMTTASGDHLTATALYIQADGAWKRWTPMAQAWLEVGPEPGENVVEIDEMTARFLLETLTYSGNQPADVRDVDPAESMLHDECMSDIDWDFIDRLLLEDAVISITADAMYTPEERSQNASKQVRDKMGRFAKSNDSVRMDDGSTGKIIGIDPTTQSLRVRLADGNETKVPAKTATIYKDPKDSNIPTLDDLKKIPGVPRATGRPGIAQIPTLPILGKQEIDQILSDYPAYIERERARTASSMAVGRPETDVEPIYLAIVDSLDPESVLDMLAVVPASPTSTSPKVLRLDATGWIDDPASMAALKSSTPPPVVKVEGDLIDNVISQVSTYYASQATPEEDATEAQVGIGYGEFGELVAAGNRVGGAEKLREYWTTGKGGAKIRWGTPGDWTRCYRHLKKYMGPRAKGYCANLHKRMTGMWPGDKNNRDESLSLRSSEEILDATFSALLASGEAPPSDVAGVRPMGKRFIIPVLAPVSTPSGDGRAFDPMALSHRDLPLPLMWQIQTASGHDGAVVVGRIETIETMPDGSFGNARGVFDVGAYGAEAERMVFEKFLRGVSVDLDMFEATSTSVAPSDAAKAKVAASDDDEVDIINNNNTEITKARVMGATIVAKPAFQECYIQIEEEEPVMIEDGDYAGLPAGDVVGAEEALAAALVASAIPVNPPAAWFANPALKGPTPITVDDEGRVFGHIATWKTDHIGLPFSTKPPRSRSGYAYFHTGALRTAEGEDVHVGQLTLAGGHAGMNASAAEAKKHYDDTGSAFADVHAGEDKHGIWVAGALRPSVTPEQIRAARASAPSGDWRPINGRLEMVAVCQVNVPGFPVARARVASGSVMALVAAGTSVLAHARAEQTQDRTVSILEQRVAALEAPQRAKLDRLREASIQHQTTLAMRRFETIRETPLSVLSDIEAARARFASIATPQPTEMSVEEAMEDARARFSTLLAAGNGLVKKKEEEPVDPDFKPENHPRHNDGKFRAVLARLKTELEADGLDAPEVNARLDAALKKAVENDTANEEEVKAASEDVLHAIDKYDVEKGEAELPAILREVYKSLGGLVYNETIDLGSTDVKMRYSDLPTGVQDLITNLITQVENLGGDGDGIETSLAKVKSFLSGGQMLSQPEVSGELARLVRLLV
jgi:hypothetical protein